MSTDVARQTPMQEIAERVTSVAFKQSIRPALRDDAAVELFVSVMLTALQSNPELITGDRSSLFLAGKKCAEDGLLPDGREAAFVLQTVKGKKTVRYMPMILGLRKKAAEHGFSLAAYVVHENDVFTYALGVEPTVTHQPPGLGEPRGDVIGAYAVAKDRATGEPFLEVMDRADIEKVRAVSRAATSEYGPWVNWYEEQCKKTVARRLYKTLPLGSAPDIARVVEAHDDGYELPEEPRMSLEEANLHASLEAGPPVDDSVPDDSAEDERFEDVPFGDPPGQAELSFAEQAEAAQRGRAARGAYSE